MKNKIQLLSLREQDISTIVSAFGQIGWNKPASFFEGYLKESDLTHTLD